MSASLGCFVDANAGDGGGHGGGKDPHQKSGGWMVDTDEFGNSYRDQAFMKSEIKHCEADMTVNPQSVQESMTAVCYNQLIFRARVAAMCEKNAFYANELIEKSKLTEQEKQTKYNAVEKEKDDCIGELKRRGSVNAAFLLTVSAFTAAATISLI